MSRTSRATVFARLTTLPAAFVAWDASDGFFAETLPPVIFGLCAIEAPLDIDVLGAAGRLGASLADALTVILTVGFFGFVAIVISLFSLLRSFL
jgi:hypothetical protein